MCHPSSTLITSHKDKSRILGPAILKSKFHRLKAQAFPEMPCWWHFRLQADSLWDADTHKFCFIAFTCQSTKRDETQNVCILNIICKVKTGTGQPVYTGHTKLTKEIKKAHPPTRRTSHQWSPSKQRPEMRSFSGTPISTYRGRRDKGAHSSLQRATME